MKTSKYFSEDEFQRCSPSCYREDMSQDLLDRLDQLREAYGKPVYLSSAYRSAEWDLSRGRTGHGAHTRGLAVDLVCKNSLERLALVKAALSVGIPRIGVAATFIHVDIDPSLTQNVLWTY